MELARRSSHSSWLNNHVRLKGRRREPPTLSLSKKIGALQVSVQGAQNLVNVLFRTLHQLAVVLVRQADRRARQRGNQTSILSAASPSTTDSISEAASADCLRRLIVLLPAISLPNATRMPARSHMGDADQACGPFLGNVVSRWRAIRAR